jgi:anti-anti-sigma factor
MAAASSSQSVALHVHEGPLSAETTVGSGLARTSVSGELDAVTAPALTDFACEQLLTSRWTGYVLDLSGVSFCGSSGLQALGLIRNAATDAGTSLALVPSHCVRRALELLSMAGDFTLAEPSEESRPAPAW